jgi:predicted nucleotidyltransferase component of viral defense system
MIGFGELRKLSVQWQVDVAQVERIYAIDWILKGIFDHVTLAQSLALRGGSALRYAYSSEFPFADDPEFLLIRATDNDAMQEALATGLDIVASSSGLKLTLSAYLQSSSRIEYTGPLGRRSAAQPRVTVSMIPGQLCLQPAHLPLFHPFSDSCPATITAIALDEVVGQQVVALHHTSRARDVYNLWFALVKLRDQLNFSQVSNVVRQVSRGRNIALPSAGMIFESPHRATLERTWQTALHQVRDLPTFDQVERDLTEALKPIPLS